jgi:folate-binding protein YgfZ
MIRGDRALIVVSGRDRAAYLQGLLTNDTVALQPGEGCYAAYLTPQGRMISDLFVHELGDVMLLVLPRATRETVLARLDQFIFSEDVQLGDVSDAFIPLEIVGPDTAGMVSTLLDVPTDQIAALPVHGAIRAAHRGEPVILRRIDDFGILAFELLAAPDQMPAIEETLRTAGAVEMEDAAAEALRIEAGFPQFGRDMDGETIPLEAGIEERAISFTKGCYVGQEVIIRVLHRGHGRVARRLVGLVFDPAADPPAPASTLLAGDKEVGTITSSVFSPALQRPVALAYLKRDFVAPGTHVTTAAGTDAEVVALPFVAR